MTKWKSKSRIGRDISSQFFCLSPSKTFGTHLKARRSVKFKGRVYGLYPAPYVQVFASSGLVVSGFGLLLLLMTY